MNQKDFDDLLTKHVPDGSIYLLIYIFDEGKDVLNEVHETGD